MATQALNGTLPPGRHARKPSAPVRAFREKSEDLPFSQMALEQRVDFFVDLAALVKTEGILVLEQLVNHIGQKGDDLFLQDAQLLGMGLHLVVDGTWPALVNDMMATRTRTLLQLLETRHQMIVAGVLGVQEGRSPLLLRNHLFHHWI